MLWRFKKLKINLKFFPAADEKIYDERIMVITHFYTQKIIDAYNQQLTIKSRVSAGKAKELAPKDVIIISEESKRRLAAAKNESEGVNLLTKKQEPQPKGGIWMKIPDLKNDPTIQYLNQGNKVTLPEKPPALPEGQKPGAAGDKVEISSQSRELQKMQDILAQTPDVRSEKVAAIKKAIEEGRYQVNAENVAQKMIQEILVESSRE